MTHSCLINTFTALNGYQFYFYLLAFLMYGSTTCNCRRDYVVYVMFVWWENVQLTSDCFDDCY